MRKKYCPFYWPLILVRFGGSQRSHFYSDSLWKTSNNWLHRHAPRQQQLSEGYDRRNTRTWHYPTSCYKHFECREWVLLLFRLHFWLKVQLQFMANVLNWIGVQAFRRGPPPVDTMLIKNGLCTLRGVFGIIVLHKTVVWQSLIDEWNQCPQECCNTDRTALFPRKYRFSWGPSCWCQPRHEPWTGFRFWLSLCWFIDLSIARVAKLSLEHAEQPPVSWTCWLLWSVGSMLFVAESNLVLCGIVGKLTRELLNHVWQASESHGRLFRRFFSSVLQWKIWLQDLPF